jgi:hypothetical protein
MADMTQQITAWLKSHGITKFTIDPVTFTVDVHEDAHLDEFHQVQFPIQFGIIEGNFTAVACGLTTLIHCPTEVQGYFSVHNNTGVASAVGGPTVVYGLASFAGTKIKSIEGLPRDIRPSKTGGPAKLELDGTKITDFTGIHRVVRNLQGTLDLGKSAKNVKKGLTSLVAIRGLTEVTGDVPVGTPIEKAFKIVNHYIKLGTRASMECANALDDAGLGEFE